MFGKRPREQRKLASLSVQMKSGADWREITIANISEGGFLGKSECPPKVGTSIEIHHRGRVIFGQVIRSTGRRFAVRSNEPIDVATFLEKADFGGLVSEIPETIPRTRLWHWRARP